MPAVAGEQRGAGTATDESAARARRDWWVGALRREGAEFAAAVTVADLDDDVPTCPGWTVRRLVSHLSRVHRSGLNGVLDGTVEPPALAARLVRRRAGAAAGRARRRRAAPARLLAAPAGARDHHPPLRRRAGRARPGRRLRPRAGRGARGRAGGVRRHRRPVAGPAGAGPGALGPARPPAAPLRRPDHRPGRG